GLRRRLCEYSNDWKERDYEPWIPARWRFPFQTIDSTHQLPAHAHLRYHLGHCHRKIQVSMLRSTAMDQLRIPYNTQGKRLASCSCHQQMHCPHSVGVARILLSWSKLFLA